MSKEACLAEAKDIINQATVNTVVSQPYIITLIASAVVDNIDMLHYILHKDTQLIKSDKA
jgi:hypothetical protein